MARGRRLEYLTLAWNSLEAVVALASGIIAGSVALVGFGLDSVIEMVSAVILLWRLRSDRAARRERDERKRIVWQASAYWRWRPILRSSRRGRCGCGRCPERSIAGIAIAFAAVIVMPLLGRAKRRVAARADSGALHSDSRQADFCAYLSAILLLGLAAELAAGLVVGRRGGSADHGSHHRARRGTGASRESVRGLRMQDHEHGAFLPQRLTSEHVLWSATRTASVNSARIRVHRSHFPSISDGTTCMISYL